MLSSVGTKILIILFFTSTCFALDFNPIKFSGETNFEDGKSTSLISKIGMEYKMSLYEADNFGLSLYGKLHTDLDHFGNEIKTNVFTTINIDF